MMSFNANGPARLLRMGWGVVVPAVGLAVVDRLLRQPAHPALLLPPVIIATPFNWPVSAASCTAEGLSVEYCSCVLSTQVPIETIELCIVEAVATVANLEVSKNDP